MKLPQFLKKIDTFSSSMSRDQLERLLHEIARTAPEKEREKLLSLFTAFAVEDTDSSRGGTDEGGDGHSFNHSFDDDKKNERLEKEIDSLMETLEELEEGERSLVSDYNYEYDDWYNSDVDEFTFTDPDGILDDIGKAMEFVHVCMDRELYRQGFELADLLSCVSVSVEGAYLDYDDGCMDLETLNNHDLLKDDVYQLFLREAIYLCYLVSAPWERAEEILRLIGNLHYQFFKLEEIMQMGNGDLPDFNAFLQDWIRVLSAGPGGQYERMLQDALSMIQDEKSALEVAKQSIQTHPALLEKLMMENLDTGEPDLRMSMLKAGQSALEQLPSNIIIRSRIALLTASYAVRLDNTEESERCLLEAFRSQTTTLNYLRLRFLTKDWEKYRAKALEIFEEMIRGIPDRKGSGFYSYHSGPDNVLGGNDCCCILYFQEEFEKMRETGMTTENVLGWSSTFMKKGIALMLLLLHQGEDYGKGMLAMLSRAREACGFDIREYYRGTAVEAPEAYLKDEISFAEEADDDEVSADEKAVFSDLLKTWKKEVHLSGNDAALWMERIDHWIEWRVEGIMNANKRNYYGECASFIAAFGEVQESRGIPKAKALIMERYRAAYSRRRAFRDELCLYGMKKQAH